MHEQSEIPTLVSALIEEYLDVERAGKEGSVAARWYEPDNIQAWSRKLSVLAAFVKEHEGILVAWQTNYGEGRMLVTVSRQSAVRVPHSLLEEDGLICDGEIGANQVVEYGKEAK